MKITYHKINIEDNEEVPIQLSFSLAYDFIENVISPKKLANPRWYQTDFDVVQQFKDMKKQSASMVYSASKTHSFTFDLLSKKVHDIADPIKDKIYEMDLLCEKNTHHSHNQNRVLVHCAMGRSRSATMVIMYLMKKFEISLDRSLQIVKSRREVVDPNEGFLKRLKEFEKQQRRKSIAMVCHSAKIFCLPSKLSTSSSSSSEDLLERRRSVDI